MNDEDEIIETFAMFHIAVTDANTKALIDDLRSQIQRCNKDVESFKWMVTEWHKERTQLLKTNDELGEEVVRLKLINQELIERFENLLPSADEVAELEESIQRLKATSSVVSERAEASDS